MATVGVKGLHCTHWETILVLALPATLSATRCEVYITLAKHKEVKLNHLARTL